MVNIFSYLPCFLYESAPNESILYYLQAVALTRSQEDEKDFFSFLARNTNKNVQDFIECVWNMHGTPEKENSETFSRTWKLVLTGNQECIPECIGKWLEASCQVLSWNNINKLLFAAAVRELLEKDRKKRLIISLAGLSSCEKRFLSEPLEHIFYCFTNITQDKYAWTGLDETGVSYINNFCWSKELIAWWDLLYLLGDVSKHSCPKNFAPSNLRESRILFQIHQKHINVLHINWVSYFFDILVTKCLIWSNHTRRFAFAYR